MRSGAKYRQDVSAERKGSKKTSFERKGVNSMMYLVTLASLSRPCLQEYTHTGKV